MERKNIVVLGSTGSIGTNTLAVAAHLGAGIRVVGLAAGRNIALLVEQAKACGAGTVVLGESEHYAELRAALPPSVSTGHGVDAMVEMATQPDVDIVVCAIVGTAGLRPVIEALKLGKTVALASKEILVMAGALIRELLAQYGGQLVPIDSEHSAILQCIEGRKLTEVSRLILTASGGPFRDYAAQDFKTITPKMTQCHPTWRMGRKITVDSATLMNKALEYIEAHFLFEMPTEKIEVVVHPQSIVHSMVEFTDNTILAQLGEPDMRLPIQYALTYPDKLPGPLQPFDFTRHATLTFEKVNPAFPSIDFARDAVNAGQSYPAALNAANEVAVERFFSGDIGFGDIFKIVETVLKSHVPTDAATLESILAADADARRCAGEWR